jgi:hypothetical protein
MSCIMGAQFTHVQLQVAGKSSQQYICASPITTHTRLALAGEQSVID